MRVHIAGEVCYLRLPCFNGINLRLILFTNLHFLIGKYQTGVIYCRHDCYRAMGRIPLPSKRNIIHPNNASCGRIGVL